MRAEQLMTKQVKSCRPGDTLDRAAQLMWDNDCGCLPVSDGDGINRVVGVITDRDICMSAFFQGKPLRDLRVTDAMSKQVRVCRPGDSIVDVERAMREGKVRRLPVVDDQGVAVGMISLADLARAAHNDQRLPAPEITGNEVGVTLASICQSPPENHRAATA